MAGRSERNTKAKIARAAWKLFYDKGYENTTVEEIIEESATSKGSFYHYFDGKDGLLGSLASLFDEKYRELEGAIPDGADVFEVLLYLNRQLFAYIESSVDMELLARLYSTQLVTRGERQLLDHRREYYRLLRRLISRGQERGEIRRDVSPSELVRLYAMAESGLLYEWCLSGGEYSLTEGARLMLPMMLSGIRGESRGKPFPEG